MSLVLGCIADDLTGATDLALVLSRNGMRVVLVLDIPADDVAVPEAEAVVVALKTRTVKPEKAVRQSLAALDWLQAAGASRVFFKYCSTFDSTKQGNIGPVAEALADRLGPEFTVFCPAFPANRRTVYQGHLFVKGRLLSESSLAAHPLTPMTDPDLVRVLQAQCSRYRVGLIPLETVDAGTGAVLAAMERLQSEGCRFGVADAVNDAQLATLADACSAQPLLTGGSAVTAALPAIYRLEGRLPPVADRDDLPARPGPVAVLSGSCSEASRAQVAELAARCPAVRIDPLALGETGDDVAALLDRAGDIGEEKAVLFYATADPEAVAAAQDELGRWRAGEMVEKTLAELAFALVARGVRKLIVAGGESSGAVARRLGLEMLRVGPEIDPGVPWMSSLSEPGLLLAFKSGNFGKRDFFLRAAEMVA